MQTIDIIILIAASVLAGLGLLFGSKKKAGFGSGLFSLGAGVLLAILVNGSTSFYETVMAWFNWEAVPARWASTILLAFLFTAAIAIILALAARGITRTGAGVHLNGLLQGLFLTVGIALLTSTGFFFLSMSKNLGGLSWIQEGKSLMSSSALLGWINETLSTLVA